MRRTLSDESFQELPQVRYTFCWNAWSIFISWISYTSQSARRCACLFMFWVLGNLFPLTSPFHFTIKAFETPENESQSGCWMLEAWMSQSSRRKWAFVDNLFMSKSWKWPSNFIAHKRDYFKLLTVKALKARIKKKLKRNVQEVTQTINEFLVQQGLKSIFLMHVWWNSHLRHVESKTAKHIAPIRLLVYFGNFNIKTIDYSHFP